MARLEKLEETDITPAPGTFAEKLSNFWYYHKWKVIIGAAALLLFVICGFQMCRNSDVDLTVMYAGSCLLSRSESAEMGIWPANGNHSFRAGGAVYNYDPVCLYTAGKQAQAVQSLVFGSLPSSVYLDRSWFGHPAFSSTVTDEEGSRIVSGDGRWWSVQAIVEYGGWGMEFFSPLSAAEEPSPEIDLAISPVLPNADYVSGLGTVISFAVSNNSSVKDITPDDGTYVRITVSVLTFCSIFCKILIKRRTYFN